MQHNPRRTIKAFESASVKMMERNTRTKTVRWIKYFPFFCSVFPFFVLKREKIIHRIEEARNGLGGSRTGASWKPMNLKNDCDRDLSVVLANETKKSHNSKKNSFEWDREMWTGSVEHWKLTGQASHQWLQDLGPKKDYFHHHSLDGRVEKCEVTKWRTNERRNCDAIQNIPAPLEKKKKMKYQRQGHEKVGKMAENGYE